MSESQRVKYLEEDRILHILNQLIEDERDIRASVKASKSSFSIYFRLYKGSVFISRRISDHKTNKGLRTLLVGPTTKYKHVEVFIKRAIKDVKTKYRSSLFKMIEEQKKNEKIDNICKYTS